MEKIIIQTNADFTPKGKRSARVVQTTRGEQLRWYVGGRLFRRFPVIHTENVKLTHAWINA